MLADAARTYLNRYGVKVGDARSSSSTAHDSAYRAALDLQGGRRRDRADRRPARRGGRAAAAGARAPPASGRGHGVGARASKGDARLAGGARSRADAGRHRTDRLRRAADVRRLDAVGASLLAVARQARLRRGAARSSCPGASVAARALRRRLQRRPSSSPRRSPRARGRREAAAARGLRAPPRRALRASRARRTPRRRRSARPLHVLGDRNAQGLRRLPERRLRQGHRARGAGGHPLDRARQALHHHRHGDRPGQDLQHERARDRRRRAGASRSPRSGSPPSAALYAGDLRRLRRRRRAATCSIRSARTPIHGWAAAKGAAFEDVGLWKRAWYFPRAGETCTPRSRASAARCARRSACSTPRRSARSRSSGPTPPRSSSACTPTRSQKLEVGRCRYGLMLNENGFVMDDGVIAPHRARPLPRHDDDRRRAARARPHGGLSADRVHRPRGLADLDDRAMGGHRRAGADARAT